MKTEHPHVRRDENGRPVVGAARMDVHVLARLMQLGTPVEEMAAGYPFLSKGEILDALSYYCDHEDEVNDLIRANQALDDVSLTPVTTANVR
jgi:uncharacterized protein (DUF433 family)